MKQIILENNAVMPAESETCLAGLATRWAVYGLAIAALWQLLGPSPVTHAFVWAVAWLVGLRLLRVV